MDARPDPKPDPDAVSPTYRHHCERCECLGRVSVNDTAADVFVCDALVIARFSDRPDDYVAQHMHALTPRSSVFLLAALRLHLDRVGEAPEPADLIHGPPLRG